MINAPDVRRGRARCHCQIANAVDLHCHYGLDALESEQEQYRSGVPAIDAAREAETAGDAALVLKSHTFPSVSVAEEHRQEGAVAASSAGSAPTTPSGTRCVCRRVGPALGARSVVAYARQRDGLQTPPASPRHTSRPREGRRRRRRRCPPFVKSPSWLATPGAILGHRTHFGG